ncbi:hypothetical protein JM654_15315 [Microbacterium oxydans]|nr:hypothetical protein [Microbacterium oxydans]
MDAAASTANEKALLHPFKAGNVVRSSNEVAADVLVFNERIGIDTTSRDAIQAKRWIAAVGEARDRAVEAGGEGVDVVRRFGMKTFEDAKVVGEKLGQEFAERMPQRRSSPDADVDDER